MPRFIGFDAHKSYAYVVELGGDRQLNYRVALPGGLTDFKQRLDSECQIVIEASTSTFRLVDELAPHVGRVVVSDPAQTRGAVSHVATTDRNAAEALARLLASDFVRPVWVPPREIRSLRSLVELRNRLAGLRTISVNRIRALLRQELVPGRIALTEAVVQERLCDDPTLEVFCSSLFRFRDLVKKECERVDDALRSWCRKSEDARLLMSIPGVGPLVATCLVAQVGDIKRFDSPRKLCSYAGLVPKVYISGQSQRSGGISKKGRSSLRWAMSIAVMSATQVDGPFKELKEKLCLRKPKGVAMVACARKLLEMVWRVWTKRQPYADQNEQRYARKLAALDRSVGRKGLRKRDLDAPLPTKVERERTTPTPSQVK